MTAVDDATEVARPSGDDPPRSPRSTPAPPANRFWRFVFPVLLVGAGVGVFLLWETGTKAVLDSTDGRVRNPVSDPAEPGYEAFVAPTPTMLVAHVDADELVGVTVMARTALDDGGSAVLFSADLGVEPVDAPETLAVLGQVHREEGLVGLERVVSDLVGFGFTETLELDTDGLATFMGLVEPIDYFLADDLVRETVDGSTEVWLERGEHELDGETAAEVYGFRNPGEFDAARVERQDRLWLAWLAAVGAADDIDAATLPFGEGLSPYLRSLAEGTSDVEVAPADPVQFEAGERPVYLMGDGELDWLQEQALAMVPLPISPVSIQRATVRLLDGVDDSDARDELASLLVADGAVISVIGNAPSFDVDSTTVVYHRPEVEDTADAVATTLGTTADLVEDLDVPVDITVTIGRDLDVA